MDQYLERVIDNIAARVPVDGETYMGEDGLLYCEKCHTARQCRVSPFGTERIVPCYCECKGKAWKEEIEAMKERERISEIMGNRKAGFPDREMMAWTFEADDIAMPSITHAMKAYVENFPELRKSGKGLLLYGNVGTGKTFMAACVVNALIDRGYPCMMTSFSRLSNIISGMWGEEKQGYIDSLSRFALIAIDDLGVERDTEYMNEQVTTIIDSLYCAKVPLIITSNHTPKQLTEDCEIRKKRVYDRLLERTHPVKVDGPSRRKEIGRNDFKTMNKLLGL